MQLGNELERSAIFGLPGSDTSQGEVLDEVRRVDEDRFSAVVLEYFRMVYSIASLLLLIFPYSCDLTIF